MKKYYPYILVIVLVSVLMADRFVGNKYFFSKKTENQPSFTTTTILTPPVSVEPTPAEDNFVLPSSHQISGVPFQSQAPFANWDQLHDEACEEASVVIVQYYNSRQSLSVEAMEEQIQNMVSWEINYFGSHKDLTAAETKALARNFYDLNLKIKNISSIDDIKKEIAQDHLVIIPTAGRLLGNPNFRSPGPVYHMLVVSGYDGNKITTQDVGTRNGQNYVYNEEVLFNAIHDWNGSPESINSGEKVILVLEV